jgi:hypothetical protein
MQEPAMLQASSPRKFEGLNKIWKSGIKSLKQAVLER